ncbi:hypothetical protein [Streptomyces pactum]|uniref:hypothetical protein n=1 Tax=Streptomyces pactum TaxID=68249 RepID=UPI0036FEA8AD
MGSSHASRRHTFPDAAKAAAGTGHSPTTGPGQAARGPGPGPATKDTDRPASRTADASGQPREESRDGRPGGAGGDRRTVTVPVPSLGAVADGALHAATFPVALARQVLPAKKGLPLYLGLGVLGAADVLDWPVAFGIGIGYAVLRGDGRSASGRGPRDTGRAEGPGPAPA